MSGRPLKEYSEKKLKNVERFVVIGLYLAMAVISVGFGVFHIALGLIVGGLFIGLITFGGYELLEDEKKERAHDKKIEKLNQMRGDL